MKIHRLRNTLDNILEKEQLKLFTYTEYDLSNEMVNILKKSKSL